MCQNHIYHMALKTLGRLNLCASTFTSVSLISTWRSLNISWQGRSQPDKDFVYQSPPRLRPFWLELRVSCRYRFRLRRLGTDILWENLWENPQSILSTLEQIEKKSKLFIKLPHREWGSYVLVYKIA